MRGEQLALQIKGHTKTPRSPSDIFRLPFPSLKILLTPLYWINKMIMGSSVDPSLRSCALADVLSDKKIMGAGAENGLEGKRD